MIFLDITFPSVSLMRPVRISASLPFGMQSCGQQFRVLWALHCAMADGEIFFRRLDISETAASMGAAVIAPSLGNGFFIDSHLERQAAFLKEMYAAFGDIFPLSRKKEDNAVIGISMGGFGALRWALTENCFGSVAAISGMFDCLQPPDERMRKDRRQKAMYSLFSKNMRQLLLDNDSLRQGCDLEKLLAAGNSHPHIYLYCGDEDFLSLAQTLQMDKLCGKYGYNVDLHIASGSHDEVFWHTALQNVVKKIFSNKAVFG